jgi:calcineurin-like phosphoesterase family protein
MGIFFTSDEHYSHANIIKFCNRPFADTQEMKESLIANHNKVVRAGDRVYHLGDIFWHTTSDNEALEIITRLNGQHYYIYGNHEEVLRNKAIRERFQWCKDTENLKISGYPNIFLCHYAMRVWNGSHKNSWHLFGHSHNALADTVNKDDSKFSFDVGVDAQHYSPISLEQVKDKMITKGWKL